MKLKNDFKQRNKMIQGLRSFKDALPVKIKKVIDKKGHIFSKLLDNWKFIVGEDLFKVCFPIDPVDPNIATFFFINLLNK